MLKQVQHDCWVSRHSELVSESNTEEMLKRVQHDCWVSRHSELVSESNIEEMLKRVQHDRWVSRHSELVSESIYFFICEISIFIFLCRQENETKETLGDASVHTRIV